MPNQDCSPVGIFVFLGQFSATNRWICEGRLIFLLQLICYDVRMLTNTLGFCGKATEVIRCTYRTKLCSDPKDVLGCFSPVAPPSDFCYLRPPLGLETTPGGSQRFKIRGLYLNLKFNCFRYGAAGQFPATADHTALSIPWPEAPPPGH